MSYLSDWALYATRSRSSDLVRISSVSLDWEIICSSLSLLLTSLAFGGLLSSAAAMAISGYSETFSGGGGMVFVDGWPLFLVFLDDDDSFLPSWFLLSTYWYWSSFWLMFDWMMMAAVSAVHHRRCCILMQCWKMCC